MMEQELAEKQVAYGDEIILVNQQLELNAMTTLNKDSTAGVSVSGDGAWNTRGRTSLSGWYSVFGNQSLLCLAIHFMTLRCNKCDRKKEHSKEECNKNFEGSSKSMESKGALICIKKIHRSGITFVREMVIDDDAPTAAILKHKFRDIVKDKGQMPL